MKYKFTGKTKQYFGRTLHQIVCVTAFASISVGDVGGWIEKEENLSQYGDAWVYGNARVYGNAEVCGNARVYGDALVYGNARVFGNARVYGNAWVYGDARVYGDAWVYGNAWVYGDAEVCTKKAWTISTGFYHVTITDTHITIGCQSRTIDFWRSASAETVREIDGEKSAENWDKFKAFILALEQERNNDK